jgi:hypothetical protein
MKKAVTITIILVAALIAAYIVYAYLPTAQAQSPVIPVLTITYDDGTSRTWYPPNFKPSGLTYTIIDPSTNKKVVSIKCEFYATVVYTGQPTGWSCSGTFYWYILDSSKSVLYQTSQPLSASGSSAPPNNQPYVVTSATASADAIESLYSGWVDGGTYYLRYRITGFTYTLNFPSGAQTKSATVADLDWQFKYQAPEQFISLTISWNFVPTYG